MRLGATPVPIPNTMVKTQSADGTMLATAWESRWLPELVYSYAKRIDINAHLQLGLVAQPVRASA